MSFPRTSEFSKRLARKQRPQPKLVAERVPAAVRKDPNSLKPGS